MKKFSQYISIDSTASDAGYWSNLSQSNNNFLLEKIQTSSVYDVISQYFPQLISIIFSTKRAAGLELLNLSGKERCIDLGCMWGALTIPLAKQTHSVVGVDQTLESLRLTEKRLLDEDLDNVKLVNANLKTYALPQMYFDLAVVNGVLEWIPEEGHIDLQSYYGRFSSKPYKNTSSPSSQHRLFLSRVYDSLTIGGRLFLSIENRYDYRLFFGLNDPHVNIPFVTFLPRPIANLLSKLVLGRNYINWIYGQDDLVQLVSQAGFSKVELFYSFPNYHEPEQIFSSKNKQFLINYRNSSTRSRKSLRSLIVSFVNILLFRFLKLGYFSPAFIVVATK